MEEQFDSPYCSVCWKAEDNAVLLTWKQFCRIDDYRKPTMFASSLLHRHPGSGFIADARNGFEDDKEDVVWGFSTLLPDMAASGCRKVCFILRDAPDLDGEMDLWTKEFTKYFSVGRVQSYEAAVKFLHE